MKHFANNSNLDGRLFGILLRPSFLSAFIGIVLSIGLVAFSIISSHYKGSSTRLLFLKFNADQSHGSAQAIGRTLDSNKFISNLPLLLFWCLVGFVVYMFAVNIFGVVQRAAELGDELNHFTNLNRGQIIRESLEKLWDAWERLKTVEPGRDKKASARALLDQATREPVFRQMIEDEANALLYLVAVHECLAEASGDVRSSRG